MPLTQINFTLSITNRTHMREDVIKLFTAEIPGTGKESNASRYHYTVESYLGQYSIVLKRPVNLNKGFDFTVNIIGLNFKKTPTNQNPRPRRYSNPSHNDIISALSYCKANNQIYMQVIKPIIDMIYNCQNINLSTTGFKFLDYMSQPHPIEIILLALKWLFIEQDITYWNTSGRAMLYSKLQDNNLV